MAPAQTVRRRRRRRPCSSASAQVRALSRPPLSSLPPFLFTHACPGRLLLRLQHFMSSASWLAARPASSRVLDKYRAFARRLRDEAGAAQVQQLQQLTARLLKQEITPADYALCATRVLRAHKHLLAPLFHVLAQPAMAARSCAPTLKPFTRDSHSTLPLPWEDAARPLAPPPPSAAAAAPPPPSAAAAAAAAAPFQLLSTARNQVPSAVRAIVAGELYALGCPWTTALPPDSCLHAARSLSHFTVATLSQR